MDTSTAVPMSAVGSSVEYAVETSAVKVPTILVLADSMLEMMSLIDGIVGSASGAPPLDPVPESRLVRLDNDRLGSDAGIAARSPTKALTPCWVPLTKSGPRAVVALSGGRNPNGVGTFAGPVEKP